MDIYSITQDTDFKELLFENEDSATRVLKFRGQSLKENWKPLSLFLYDGKTKKEKQKREDFDAGCFFSGRLFIRTKMESLFYDFLNPKIELLPIIVDSQLNIFSFLNVLNCIDAIDFSDKNSYEEKMNMMRGNEIKFVPDNVKNEIIFRDKRIEI